MNKSEPIIEIERDIRGEAYLERVEPGHWPRGMFYADAVVMYSEYSHIQPGKKLTKGQEERGRALTERLRSLLQAQLLDTGWRLIAHTEEGLPIWRPAPTIALARCEKASSRH